MRLLPARASGPLAAIVVASATAPSSAVPGSVRRLTSPSSWARSDEVIRPPVSRQARSRMLRGSMRGRRKEPPPAATSERLTSGMPSFAPAAATDQSQAKRYLETTGHREALDRRDLRLVEARSVMPAKPRPATHGISPPAKAFKIMPAQKNPPAPVMIATDNEASASSSSEACSDSLRHLEVDGVRWSGRLSVTTSTRSRRSVTTDA